jgi:hypothetical protein
MQSQVVTFAQDFVQAAVAQQQQQDQSTSGTGTNKPGPKKDSVVVTDKSCKP